MKHRSGFRWLLALAVTGLLLSSVDHAPATPQDKEMMEMMGGMMPMMQMCQQMMQQMKGGGMGPGMMGMMGRGMGSGMMGGMHGRMHPPEDPRLMSPEEREIAKLHAEVQVKRAELHRLLLEDPLNPDAVRKKLKEIHELEAEIEFRHITTVRSRPPEKPEEKPGPMRGPMDDMHRRHHPGLSR